MNLRALSVSILVMTFLLSTMVPAFATSSQTIGPVTIATSSLQCDNGGDKGCTDYSYQHKVFYDTNTNLYWAFWVFANAGEVSCSTSSNGTVWTTPVTIAKYHDGQAAQQIDFYHNDTTGAIYYAEADPSGSDGFANYGFWFRYGTLSALGCGSIDWSIPESPINVDSASIGANAISITVAPNNDVWVAFSQFGAKALVLECSSGCSNESSWSTSLQTSGMKTSLAQVVSGSNSSDIFVLTGCSTSDTYLGGACTGKLLMYYTNNGGVSWAGPVATSGTGYYSITMNMITIGDTAYVTMSTSGPLTSSDNGYDWFSTFTTLWSNETLLQTGYSSVIGYTGNTLFVFYESAPICPTTCTNSNIQHNYTISYVTSSNLGGNWSGQNILFGPLLTFFSEGPSLSSGSAYTTTSGIFAFLWTPDDSNVEFGAVVNPQASTVTSTSITFTNTTVNQNTTTFSINSTTTQTTSINSSSSMVSLNATIISNATVSQTSGKPLTITVLPYLIGFTIILIIVGVVYLRRNKTATENNNPFGL